jgi:hypothetical protein
LFNRRKPCRIISKNGILDVNHHYLLWNIWYIYIHLYIYMYICDNMYLWHCRPYSKKLVRGQERWSVSPRFRWVIPCLPGSTKPCDQTAAKLLSWFYDVNCLYIYHYYMSILSPYYIFMFYQWLYRHMYMHYIYTYIYTVPIFDTLQTIKFFAG